MIDWLIYLFIIIIIIIIVITNDGKCAQQEAQYWKGLVKADNEIRKDLGLRTPSIDELQLLLDAAEPTSRAWSDSDIVLLLNRSKFERTELDEIKHYHKARYDGSVCVAVAQQS